MKRSFLIPTFGAGKGGCLAAWAGLGALVYFSISPSLLPAVQVRVRDGQEVRLLLHNILTTESVEKDDTIDFDVAEDVVVNGHTVIVKGAPAMGKVVRVKGAGKKKAKDASVTFRLVSVRAVDNQQVQLRKNPYKDKKKGDSKENEIEEDQAIPGLMERAVGAEKGKMYIAFLDQSPVINVAETPTTPPPTPPTGQTATQPTNQPPQPAPPTGILAQEPAVVDFVSDPSGADIMIDGNFVGNTPSTLQVTAGRHAIELRLSGYRSYTVTMRVDAGSHPRISKTLEKE